jgi:N-acetylneuraminate synthase
MGTEMKTLIIAEAGVNHNGSLDMARQLIDVAADAGADIVKFQTFKADTLVSKSAPKAEYQTRTTDAAESQHEMIRKLELSAQDHEDLIAHCRKRGIAFLSTPFDVASLHMLTGQFGMEMVKVPSGEITNAPFLVEIGRVAKRVIVSTGTSTMGEIEDALGVLAFAMIDDNSPPGREAFKQAFASPQGGQALQDKVTLLHCTTEYPAPVADVNLRAMDSMAAAFGVPVGYSDHTAGIHVAIAAVARGACIVEKHYTLDRNLPGPDHKASLEPGELKMMISAIRDVEGALGDGIKRPTPSEWKNRVIARKSLVAAKPIQFGEELTPDNVACMRPGSGMSPFEFWRFCGCKASRGYAKGDLLDE